MSMIETGKHTPGPWKYKRGPHQGLHSVIAGEREYVFSSEGDARLIAAAPELAEALARWLDWHDGQPMGMRARLADDTRAALAKARGEK